MAKPKKYLKTQDESGGILPIADLDLQTAFTDFTLSVGCAAQFQEKQFIVTGAQFQSEKTIERRPEGQRKVERVTVTLEIARETT